MLKIFNPSTVVAKSLQGIVEIILRGAAIVSSTSTCVYIGDEMVDTIMSCIGILHRFSLLPVLLLHHRILDSCKSVQHCRHYQRDDSTSSSGWKL